MEAQDLPLVAVLNKSELDGGFSFLKRGFRGVLGRSHLAGLVGGGHERLSLGWLALL